MYLKEVVINGFKSFADRTRLDLCEGVTAVVGPNGCGKSNIVDAIRWVLGEQSAKALRGASMQDVIFEGTDKRKALSTCEVTLTFTDCEAELGTHFNEVAISRRVTRDGSSDYYINGKVSRLKDIQRLFANTGVGRVSYSFMLQGQIDQILSTNPGERRTIFEEAAGITLYKAQRKESLNKLALVDTNLSRVADVVEEVSRQIGSLKRQASKALRYQRIKHRLTHLDLAYNAHCYSDLCESIEQLKSQASLLRDKVESQTVSLERDEEILLEKKSERTVLTQKIEDLQQRAYNLRSEKDSAENQSEFASLRGEDMESRAEGIKKEIADLELESSDLAQRAKNELENKQIQISVVDDSDRFFQERNNELTVVQDRLVAMESDLQKNRQEVLNVENRINRLRSSCTTLEVDLKTYQVKHASLTENITSLSEEIILLEKGLSNIKEILFKRRTEVEASESSVELARSDLREVLNHYRSLQESIQKQDRCVAQKTAQINVLEDLQANFEGFGEGAKAILENKLGQLATKDSVSIIYKELSVDAVYTTALETLLGSAADTLYIGDSKKALSIIGKLDAEFLGRVCLQIDLKPTNTATNIELPDRIIAAESVVRVGASDLKGPVNRLLKNCYFADSLEYFIEFWRENPDFDFFLVSTHAGEIIDCRGLIHGGRTSGNKSSSVLERESDIRSLRKEINAERAELYKLREQAKALDEQRIALEATVDVKLKRQSELASEASALAAEERNQCQKIEINSRCRSESEEEIARLEAKHGDSISELEATQSDLIVAEQNLKNQRQVGSDLEAAINRVRTQRDEQREALSDVRLELAEKKQRLDSVDRTLSDVEQETANLQSQILRRNQEIDMINEQVIQLKQSCDSEHIKSEELGKTLIVTTNQLTEDRLSLKKLDAFIADIDNGLSRRRSESRSSGQDLNKLEVQLAEARSQLGFISSTSQTDYQIDLSQVDWKDELWESNVVFEKRVNLDDLDDPDQLAAQPKQERSDPTEEELAAMDLTDWSAIEQELGDLKGRIANMGPVNLEAISEYSELNERYSFLKEQSEDLWNSKNKLIQTIDEINETSQTLFSDTFEQVRKNFAFSYEKISGGGDSDLILVDSDDPLESGIDIIARPPGTRLKNVTLLSGGQRTMTAVALLFAIYMVKPSPFCVLDEIDAALDDANIGRFCDILSGFTDKSQFLIVTHNKRTISNADTVFGVTMPEKGVSNLVSMRFNNDDKR